MMLFIALLLPIIASAFPTTIQSCEAGRNAINQGAHASVRNLGGGGIDDAGFKVLIDGRQVYEGIRFDFTAGVKHTITLVATEDIMRGFLIRIGASDGADTSGYLASTNSQVQVPFYCDNINIGALCHNSRTAKKVIDGTLYVPSPKSGLTMDVTTVVSTIYSYGSGEWYVSQFNLQAVAQGTTIIYPAPPLNGGTNAPNTCLSKGATCTSDGACCTGRCIRSSTQDVWATGTCTDGDDSSDIVVSICFSGETTVQVKNKGTIMMKDLVLNDEVLVADDTYNKVYSFGHYHKTMQAEFLQLLPSSLEISMNHMVKVYGRGFIPASLVAVGDYLESADGNNIMVEEISTVVRNGVYAPFTYSGTIVVGGIQASNYVAFQGSDNLVIGGYRTSMSYQFIAHLSQAPHRIYVRLFGIDDETYTKEGMSSWINRPHIWWQWYLSQNAIIMVLLLIPAVAVLSVAAFVDVTLSLFTCC